MHQVRQQSIIARIRAYVEKYERRTSTIALILAFIIDGVTLVRVDFFLTEFLLITYLIIAGGGIFLLGWKRKNGENLFGEEGRAWLLIAIQFAFGGLFGRYLIYYSRSGTFFTSWPFFSALLILIAGNELAKKYYTRFIFHLTIFFTALFIFLIFFIPILVGSMGTGVFILSGIMSLVSTAFMINLLERFTKEKVRRVPLTIAIVGVYALVNILYFTDVIPPLPLGLRDVGVYHLVARTTNGYEVTTELQSKNLLRDILPFRKTISIAAGDPLYVYSAVFAPINFGTNIIHHWEWYSDVTKEWVDEGKVTFPIVGGQDRGYRGYSMKSNVIPGLWRVNIETENGLVVGTISFNVAVVPEEPILVKKEL